MPEEGGSCTAKLKGKTMWYKTGGTLLVGLALFSLSYDSANSRPNERWAQIQNRANGGDPTCTGACMEDAMRRMMFFQGSGYLPADVANGALQPFKQNCCGQADAYEADDYEVDHSDCGFNPDDPDECGIIAILTCNEPMDCEAIPGKTVRQPGTKFKIPHNKTMIPGRPINNTGHGWVFLTAGNPPAIICYSHPSGQ